MHKAQVVVQTAFLGDLILSVPFLRRLKSNAPEEKLILICKKGLGSFLKDLKVIDDYFEISKNDRRSYKLAKEYLTEFDITQLYCVHRSVRSLLFTSQLKAEKKIGFSSMLGFWVFDESADYEESWPDAIRKFKLLSYSDPEVKMALAEIDFSKLNTADKNGVMPPVPTLFAFNSLPSNSPNSKKVCLFPGSVWATKRWTLTGYTEVAQKLTAAGFDVLLLGGSDEKDLCDQIGEIVPQAKILAGKLSIQQSIQTVSECALVIANDSAATHMAALAGIPSISIFGPTTLDLGFRPWSDKALVVQTDLSCRPCGKHGHDVCPLGHHHCMKFIAAAQVLDKAEMQLKISSP